MFFNVILFGLNKIDETTYLVIGLCKKKGEIMSFIQRYSTIERGGIRFIGNTLGLSKISNALAAGALGSIGAFTSLTNNQFSNFPVGSTSNYLENGSSANLNLPVGSTILHAELVWGGLYRSQTQDISNLLDNAVTFIAGGNSLSISPDPTTSQNFLIPDQAFPLGFYVRTADVTNIVSTVLNGQYSLTQVPALLIANDNQTSQTNHAGWTLCVVYKNDNEIIRDLTLWVGGAVVGPNTPVSDTTLTGFSTPASLPINGKVFISAQEGDAVLVGDQFLFGKDVLSLSVISGPNNPATNFFASQINNENGLIDTTGSFGSRNANASAGTGISAERQGWDITAVDVSNKLEPSQTSAVFRFTSSGDLYVPNALATQIDSLGASLDVVKSANVDFIFVGQNADYTVTMTNTGQIDATNVTLQDILPTGLTLVNDTIRVDGVLQPNTTPVNVGTIAVGQTKTVTYTVTATSLPLVNPAINIAKAIFDFEPFPGFVIELEQDSNPVELFILEEGMNVLKLVDKAIALAGETLLYTSFISNNGNLNAENVVFTDALPANTTFVEDSVTLDGVNMPGENPANGINIGNLNVGQSKIITFQVVIN